MLRQFFVVAAVMIAGAFQANVSQAQEFPGLGVGGMWAANAEFERNFDHWARVGSYHAALMTPNDQPLPFNAMTISNSLSDGMRAFEGYNNNWHVNSRRTTDAIERWDDGAIREVAPYADPYGGNRMMLPYGPDSYYRDPAGYVYPHGDPNYYGDNMYLTD
ncbi:MAG: hypothetical protein SGJ20_02045 [Planctomycetota bacterium]|nr:hypothetical protein [Planctomycetota bacterium]